MNYPDTLQYQGETIHFLDTKVMLNITGKPTRVRYALDTAKGVKIKLVAHDFGKGIDFAAIEAANKEAPLVELKVPKPKRKKAAPIYIAKLSEEEREALAEQRRKEHNERQKAYYAKKRELLPPVAAKEAKPKEEKAKKEVPAKPQAHQAFSISKDNPRLNRPKVATREMALANKPKVISQALAEHDAQIAAQRAKAGNDWHNENESFFARFRTDRKD